ncbi:MAG: GNAT family N-acetyltransferase [Acidimicrobiales bacterium]
MTVSAEVLTSLDELDDLAPAWDELAVSQGLPFMAPGLLVPWCRHVAPSMGDVRVVAVHEGGQLSGLAPFVVERTRYGLFNWRMAGFGTFSDLEPLARAGRRGLVAGEVARALAHASPRPSALCLDGVQQGSSWPSLLVQHWPRRPLPLGAHLDRSLARPALAFGPGSFDRWLAGKSRNFRSQMGRGQRLLEDAGATFDLASTPQEAARALGSFVALHHQRWQQRGGSGVVGPSVERMLADAATRLPAPERLRVWTVVVDKEPVGSWVLVAAGGEVGLWLGGFDAAWSRARPGLVLLLAAIAHAWAAGDRGISLGGGDQEYKHRFADTETSLEWWRLVNRQIRIPHSPAEMVPRRLRHRIAASVTRARASL